MSRSRICEVPVGKTGYVYSFCLYRLLNAVSSTTLAQAVRDEQKNIVHMTCRVLLAIVSTRVVAVSYYRVSRLEILNRKEFFRFFSSLVTRAGPTRNESGLTRAAVNFYSHVTGGSESSARLIDGVAFSETSLSTPAYRPLCPDHSRPGGMKRDRACGGGEGGRGGEEPGIGTEAYFACTNISPGLPFAEH